MKTQGLSVLLFGMLVSFATSLAVAAVTTEPKPESDGIDWSKEREFWSFRLPLTKARPAVKNKRWPRQPLDYFVLRRLEQKNLSPSVEADERTLVRRVTFDLTGLPPTAAEVS